MADYSPKLVQPYDVRNAFNPPLSYDDVPQARLLLYIKMVENFIAGTYFDGSMKSDDETEMATLAIVMTKIIENDPNLHKKYKPIESLELGDYSIDYETDGSAIKSIKSWEGMALKLLLNKSIKDRNSLVKMAND